MVFVGHYEPCDILWFFSVDHGWHNTQFRHTGEVVCHLFCRGSPVLNTCELTFLIISPWRSLSVQQFAATLALLISKTLSHLLLHYSLRNRSPQGCNYHRHWGRQVPLNYKKWPNCFLQFDVWQYLTKVTLLTCHF